MEKVRVWSSNQLNFEKEPTMKAVIFSILLFLISVINAQETAVPGSSKKLLVYCAAGMRKPIETLAKTYEKEKGSKVELTFDGSNRLLGQIKLTRKGDVYIPGDAEYIDMARKESLVGKSVTVCYFVPVIMVKKNNPKGIKTLQDLAVKGFKIGQGDEKAAAIGRIMPQILFLNNVDSLAWKKNIALSTPTVNELGIALKLGTIDAAIVWSAVAKPYKDVSDCIAIPVQKNVIPVVGAAVLSFSNNKAEAGMFLDFLASDKSKDVLKKEGYDTEKPVK